MCTGAVSPVQDFNIQTEDLMHPSLELRKDHLWQHILWATSSWATSHLYTLLAWHAWVLESLWNCEIALSARRIIYAVWIIVRY